MVKLARAMVIYLVVGAKTSRGALPSRDGPVRDHSESSRSLQHGFQRTHPLAPGRFSVNRLQRPHAATRYTGRKEPPAMHDLDYQTRVIMYMDYSKEIARAKAGVDPHGAAPASNDDSSGDSGVDIGASASANWIPASKRLPVSHAATGATGVTAASTGTSYSPTPAGSAALATGSGTAAAAAAAPEEKPSLFKRILSFLGLGA
jgi:hypothetical protein